MLKERCQITALTESLLVAAFWKWDSRRQGKPRTEWVGDRSELKDINLANAYRLSLQALGEKEGDEWVWPREG